MTTTTNMALILATVSETLGPVWAQMLNDALSRLDLHDHTTGNGPKITPAGMEINEDLDLQEQALQNALYLGLKAISAGQAVAGSLYRVGTNLWWKNAAGSAVQLTSGTSLAVPGTGAIVASVPASYPYSVVTGDAQSVLIVDTSSARTLNLPAATNSMFVMVKDGNGLAATNNVTITPNGTDTIDGLNASYLLDANNASVGLVSDGVSKWFVV